MLRIAICEDEELWLKQLLDILHSIKTQGELKISVFYSGEEFLLNYKDNKYDLVFMDIYMKELCGIDTVTRLRTIDADVPVVLTTTSSEHALEAYRLNIIKYLEKPVKRDDIIECLKVAQIKKSITTQLTFIIAGKEHSFSEDSILYLEQQNHNVLIHLSNNTVVSYYGKLNELACSLPFPPFYRCHKSYLVNLSNVARLDLALKTFIMKDGSHTYVKRDLLKEAEMQFDKYLFEQLRNDVN